MKPVVLVVDYERDNLDVFAGMLEKQNFEVVKANSAIEALDNTVNHKFDLFIIDLCMPRMNGLELAAHIREKQEYAHIIMTAGVNLVDARIDISKYGVDDFLLKPFTFDEISQKVSKFSSGYQAPRGKQGKFSQLEPVV